MSASITSLTSDVPESPPCVVRFGQPIRQPDAAQSPVFPKRWRDSKLYKSAIKRNYDHPVAIYKI